MPGPRGWSGAGVSRRKEGREQPPVPSGFMGSLGDRDRPLPRGHAARGWWQPGGRSFPGAVELLLGSITRCSGEGDGRRVLLLLADVQP